MRLDRAQLSPSGVEQTGSSWLANNVRSLCAVVPLGPGLLEPVGTEGVSDGEFCETSDETVPVVKSSAKKSEPDLPRLPERLIGAPNENAAE